MTDTERLIERLTEEVFSGRFAMGGGSISSDGTCTSWGGEKIMALRNPDGPKAAALIQQQAARIVELEGALQPFARGGAAANEEWKDSDDIGFLAFSTFEVTVGDFRMARAVLGETSSAEGRG